MSTKLVTCEQQACDTETKFRCVPRKTLKKSLPISMAVVKTDASTHVPSEISDDAQMTLFRAFPTTQQQVFYLGTVDVSVDEDEISNGRLWLCSLSIHSILYTYREISQRKSPFAVFSNNYNGRQDNT